MRPLEQAYLRSRMLEPSRFMRRRVPQFPSGGGGGITVVGVGTYQSSASAITLGLPSGIQADDIIVGVFRTYSGETISMSGYAAPSNSPQNNAGWGYRTSILWKRAGSSESDPTTNDSGGMNRGQLIAFRGVKAIGDPWDATSGSVDAGSSSSLTIPGVTTTVANAMIVAVGGFFGSSASTTYISSGANANLTDFTEQIDRCASEGGFGVFTGVKATAGATGNTTATLAAAGGREYWTGALTPA